MKLIKLDAIDSTNDFLKELSRTQVLENFTVVYAKIQTNGRGQMGSKWDSEAGKNLTISILIKNVIFNISEIFILNFAVSVSVLTVLKSYDMANLAIKWPNDIMADSKKIGGILVENSIKSDKKVESIVGIGLNINQINFANLSKATSMASLLNATFSIEKIIFEVVAAIEANCIKILEKKQQILWQLYHDNMFKIKVPVAFEDVYQNQFMGIIQGTSNEGKLLVLLNDNSIASFGIKEIKMLF